ncbi:UPF0175 family protein [bacterium]|nr:UPF0175 family protein [bacterium]
MSTQLRNVSSDFYWEINQLEKISRESPLVVKRGLFQLWKLAPDLHRAVIISAYLDTQISLAKAAEMLGITRQAVTELIISVNTIPHIVPVGEINTTYCMLLVPNSHSVTACRREVEQEFTEKGIPIRHLSEEDIIAEVKSAGEDIENENSCFP